MSPSPSSTGRRRESMNGKTPGKKRPQEEMAETSMTKNDASSAGKTANDPPNAAEPERESSHSETKEPKDPDTETTQKDESGASATVAVSESQPSEEQLQPFDPRQAIDSFDWQDLDSRYLAAMAEQDEIQSGLQEEFRKRMNLFNIWAQSAVVHENERATKRLKTRMHYVQRAERNLVDKRDHYLKVVKAFETALALLGGS